MSTAILNRLSWGRPRSETSAVRGATALVWALAAGVVVYWATHLAGGNGRALGAIAVMPPPAADSASVARMLGSVPVATQKPLVVRTKATLLGVVAQNAGEGHAGAALISLDGAPARPYRLGAEVADGYRLSALDTQTARLTAQGQPDWTLDMPKEYATVAAQARPAVKTPPPPAISTPTAATPAIGPRRILGAPARPVGTTPGR